MRYDLTTALRHKTYDLLEEYVKENKTGFAYIYIIMNSETKTVLCGDGSDLFYGVKTAVNEDFKFGEIDIR